MEPQSQELQPQEPIRILLIDDDPRWDEVLAIELERAAKVQGKKLEIHTASSFGRAQEMLAQHNYLLITFEIPERDLEDWPQIVETLVAHGARCIIFFNKFLMPKRHKGSTELIYVGRDGKWDEECAGESGC
jgi:hypothetical protein